LLARNVGLSPVRVEADADAARGVRLLGSPSRRVAPGQLQAYDLIHSPEEEIGGTLLVRSENGPRAEWWERRSWRSGEIRLPLHVRVREESWVVGSPAVLFPAGLRRQFVRIWNDAEGERAFRSDTPLGYRVAEQGRALGARSVPIPGRGSLLLTLEQEASLAEAAADATWRAGPEGVSAPLIRMTASGANPGADAVVAIDFGTRNTGVRVRWRRTLVPEKPAGTVDPVGDRGDADRFPTQMVLHLQERTFRWGSDAADHVTSGRMRSEEVAIDNLKTYLREGHERFVHLRPEWTNEELLARYFERVIHRVDEYFRTASPSRPLARESLKVRYVLCRPVLDANEGDEIGLRYEQALLRAMARWGIPEEAVSLVQEPVAAAIGIARRRAEDLLALPEGTAVAVVDSGGGTSHAALARVRLAGGRVSLDLADSYALRLGADNPAVHALAALEQHGFEDRREVGGNLLDRVLAVDLGDRADRLLESDGPPLPRNIWRNPQSNEPPAKPGSLLAQARVRDIIRISRRLKERFAKVSTQYLNRPPGAPREAGEVLPFPNRPDLAGIYLTHDLYERQVLGPVLRPVVGELSGRIATAKGEGRVRPGEVRRVFYVGGTNIDPFVRQHFGRAFPLAPPENDAASQSDERISERLNAVVEGAVWFDEQLFEPSPLALTLRMGGREEPLIAQGAPLLPAGIAPPRFHTEVLAPGQELDASLFASGSGLEAPVAVARGFYRNEGPEAQEVTLSVAVSREFGCVAELLAPARVEQWRFALAETAQ
jgi:hypothetical protein